MTVAIVIGSVAPYHHRLYDALGSICDNPIHVFSCAAIEPHRSWQLPLPQHYHLHVLPGIRYHASLTSHVYLNPIILSYLRRHQLRTVLVADFSPTMAIAALYARARSIPYGITTDGHLGTDPGISSLPHRWVRRILVPNASFGVGASEKSIELLSYWGLPRTRCHEVPLVTAWPAPEHVPALEQRPYDLLFAGTLDEEVKGCMFFADVVEAVRARGVRLSVRVVGNGPRRNELEQRLKRLDIECRFDGALQPEQMAEVYCSSKLLLFPSRGDAWGLVANEAVMCGTPVIGSPHAASSKMFLERFNVGIVRPLSVDDWAEAAITVLSSTQLSDSLRARRKEAIEWFDVGRSADALNRSFKLASASQ